MGKVRAEVRVSKVRVRARVRATEGVRPPAAAAPAPPAPR